MLHGEHRSRGVAVQSFRIIAELCERVRIDLLSLGDLFTRVRRRRCARTHRCRARWRRCHPAAPVRCHARAAKNHCAPNRKSPCSGRASMPLARATDDIADTRDRRLSRIAAARAQSLAGQLRVAGAQQRLGQQPRRDPCRTRRSAPARGAAPRQPAADPARQPRAFVGGDAPRDPLRGLPRRRGRLRTHAQDPARRVDPDDGGHRAEAGLRRHAALRPAARGRHLRRPAADHAAGALRDGRRRR